MHACMHACMHVCMYVCICMYACMYVCTYSYICDKKNLSIFDERRTDEILRMLRTGAQVSSARKRGFERKNDDILRMLHTRARFSSKFQDAPHGNAISNERTMKF